MAKRPVKIPQRTSQITSAETKRLFDATPTPRKLSKAAQRPHYVNNKDFSLALVDYINSVNRAKKRNWEIPQIPEYIGECFMKISEGLSHKPNYLPYPFREELVTDGILDCVKNGIPNFNISASTRTGLPNAFGYFTQIVYHAFLRRIKQEKKQENIKRDLREHAGIEAFADFGDDGSTSHLIGENMIERVRYRNAVFTGKENLGLEKEVYHYPQKKRAFNSFGRKEAKPIGAKLKAKKVVNNIESFLK
jgi:hypothetical protein